MTLQPSALRLAATLWPPPATQVLWSRRTTGTGRFGRDSIDRAPEVPVQHQVADYQHSAAVESGLNRRDNRMETLNVLIPILGVESDAVDSEWFWFSAAST